MSFDLRAQLLEVLNNGVVNGAPKVRMLVGNDTCLVSNVVVDVLKTAFAQELVSGAEGDLDNAGKLGKLFGGVGLDVGDALQIKSDNVAQTAQKRTSK